MNSNVILAQAAPRPDSYLIEINVASNGLTRIPFPVYMQPLQSDAAVAIVLKAIRLITVAVLTHGVQNEGVNAPLTELKKMVLVLVVDGREKGYNIPVVSLNDIDDGATPFTHELASFDDWQNVDFSKSYLQFANGQVSANSPYNVLLDVQYLRVQRGSERQL